MILITVMYSAGPENSFNRGYYLETHIPLVKERWSSIGLESVQLLRGVASGDRREPVYQVIALLSFRSQQEFQKPFKRTARKSSPTSRNSRRCSRWSKSTKRSDECAQWRHPRERAAGVACATFKPGTETQARQFVRTAA